MSVPALPSSLLEPVWVQFAALLPERGEFHPDHPLGCHRRRIPDRVVFEHVIAALVQGSGYERIASARCSEVTIRRRLAEWAKLQIAHRLHELALAAYDAMIGLRLDDLAVDGAITKAPCGGDKAGPSPVDRRKVGLKRSTLTEAAGVPLGLVSAPANRHDSPLLAPTRATLDGIGPLPERVRMHLDRGYDNKRARQVVVDLGFDPKIAKRGLPAPIQAGSRWPVERTHAWMNGYGKIRRCTDRQAAIVDFYLYLAAALVTVRSLIREARTCWPSSGWRSRCGSSSSTNGECCSA
jgi:hypothetical protein